MLLAFAIGIFLIPASIAFADILPQLNFSDVPSDGWYKADVDYLSQRGVIEGYSDGTFKPANQVIRAEVSAMLARLHRLVTDSQKMDKADVLAAIESLNSKIDALTTPAGECYYDTTWYDANESVPITDPIGIPDYAETGGTCKCTTGGYISCTMDALI